LLPRGAQVSASRDADQDMEAVKRGRDTRLLYDRAADRATVVECASDAGWPAAAKLPVSFASVFWNTGLYGFADFTRQL
jgi:hypothetical protein